MSLQESLKRALAKKAEPQEQKEPQEKPRQFENTYTVTILNTGEVFRQYPNKPYEQRPSTTPTK